MKEEHPFIKETIKREPLRVSGLVKKTLSVIVSGTVFGVCAAVSMSLFMPVAGEILGTTPSPVPQVTLTPGETAQDVEAPAPETASAGEDLPKDGQSPGPLELYENIYEEVLRISEGPRKALVQVCAMRDGENLLDESLLRWGDEEGILFLCSDSNYYILTTCESLLKSDHLQVIFSNGDSARGVLCKADARTGLAVVRVPAESLSEQTRQEISVARLSDSGRVFQAEPVIAIGSPAGDRDAVVYGMVTSISGKYMAADAEYNLMTTDIKGSTDGSGVLLDVQGNVVGLIVQNDEKSHIVRAVSASQLRPLIEVLSNGESIRYLGIHGIVVTEEKARALKIPVGIYVDSVEADSPAMKAGVLSGDILTALGEEEVKSMEAYTARLQELSVGENTQITLQRRGAEGLYREMDLRVTVEGR